MFKNSQSFFEKITGSIYLGNNKGEQNSREEITGVTWLEKEDEEDAQLVIDMYQTKDEIVIIAMTAGVKSDDVDISINNDVVKISAKRCEPEKVNEQNYLARELYWGSFSRTIVLPQEIDADKTEAISRDGMLILRLPKIDRTRSKNLKIKSS